MQEEIIACLDGSSRAEAILPVARGIAAAMGASLSLLRVVADADELRAEEDCLSEQARLFGARVKFVIAPDAASAILEELRQSPRALAAITTHGRTAWMEAVIGSVALKVVRGADRPVLLYRPGAAHFDTRRGIDTLVTALDGSEFSERVIPFAVEFAKSIEAKITLVQAVPMISESPALRPRPGDISESSYLHSAAAGIKKRYGIEPNWDTLHGEPGQAICRFVNGMANAMLALTSHARGGLERALFGSVAATCLRHAHVPLLLYWPKQEAARKAQMDREIGD
jgi:nucleotide-binding universal stress UspA family protein